LFLDTWTYPMVCFAFPKSHSHDPRCGNLVFAELKIIKIMSVLWKPSLDQASVRWQALADKLGREQFAPLAAELDREQRYPWETIKTLVEHKFTGLFLPKTWGGEGESLTTTVATVETLGMHCASTAAIMCAYQLGAFPILLAGNEKQKDF